LQPYYGYLQLLLVALTKLRGDEAHRTAKSLWRGVHADLRQDFQVAKIVTWWGVSSCSADAGVADSFSGSSTSVSMLFEIHSHSAVAISKFSAFASEQEYLLSPGTQLVVKSVIAAGKKRFKVTLEELDQPFLIG
jgi:hypothetical protein